jgi:glycosyltransferase involved in cell wall biosynthesis
LLRGHALILRILNVNDTLGLRTGGGTAERTFQMSRFLAGLKDVQCTVLTLDIELDKTRVQAARPAEVAILLSGWDRFYVPLWGWRTIKKLVANADVIHLMGHWSVLNLLVYWAARRAKKPYVVCPAGALPIFGRSANIKRLYNFVAGRAIIRNASAWIAVTKGELSHFEAYGIAPSRVTVIPNGVNEEDFPAADVVAFKRKHKIPDAPIILFMGRLNPIKGPDLLLEAFIKVRDAIPNTHLVFAGPDGGMLAALTNTVRQSGISEFVHFLGFVNGAERVAAYRMANLLVVPSRQEAMSIVAVEAGFCGTPVLLTDQCGFGEIKSIDARLEVPATIEGIAQGLIGVMSDMGILTEISPVWSRFVKQQYAWSSLAPEYLKLYKSILEAATK